MDALRGGILLHFNQIARALNREIYTADSSSALPGRLIRREGGPATGDADADLAYEYSGDTYRYFFTEHRRDSFDGTGGALISTVHACPVGEGCPWPQAAWDGRQMKYSDGYSRADDVIAHELTHAVTERTANLYYYMQSGALNESYSDIFGEAVDLLNQRGTDTASVKWQIGEDLPVGWVRNMANPWSNPPLGDPGKVSDPQWPHDPQSDGGGVHSNSGVPNYAFVLMTDGGTFNGRSVAGIGIQAAAKVQYRALTSYLTSGANFVDNHNALARSCEDLIGIAGISANTCLNVKAAAEAVEMNLTVPFNSPVPAFCSANEIIRTVFEDNFEAAPANWSTRTLRGTGSWVVPDTGWAKSGTRMAWGEGFATATDATLEMTNGITIPVFGRLQFNHAYAFEADPGVAYDGSVVEYTTDGATWLDAGNLIVGGDPYDPHVPITSGTGNSLAGRRAFAGDSYGYTATQLNLGSLAGRNVRFRFRFGTDNAVGNVGWVVDDVKIYACEPCTYSVLPGSVSIGAGGGSGALQLTASASACSWQASSPVSWISISGMSGTGNASISFSVAPNPGASPRSATLTIAGRPVSVSQEACTYSIQPTAASYPSVGGSGVLQVTASGPGCVWQAASNVPWISLASNGIGSGAIPYRVTPNADADPRTGLLSILGVQVAISQAEAPDTLRKGELRTDDAADRLEWLYEPGASAPGTVEFKICKVPAITWWKELVVASGPGGFNQGVFIMADIGVKDATSCANQRVLTEHLAHGFIIELWKAKFLGIPARVKTLPANYFGKLRSGSRLTLTWLAD